MKPDVEHQHQYWEGLQEEYAEAKKDLEEARILLEKVQLEKENFLTEILFGI